MISALARYEWHVHDGVGHDAASLDFFEKTLGSILGSKIDEWVQQTAYTWAIVHYKKRKN